MLFEGYSFKRKKVKADWQIHWKILNLVFFFLVPDSPSLKRKVNEIENLISSNSNPSLAELRDLALGDNGLVCGKVNSDFINKVI